MKTANFILINCIIVKFSWKVSKSCLLISILWMEPSEYTILFRWLYAYSRFNRAISSNWVSKLRIISSNDLFEIQNGFRMDLFICSWSTCDFWRISYSSHAQFSWWFPSWFCWYESSLLPFSLFLAVYVLRN